MKFVKLSVLALSLGLFVASCGNADGEATNQDSINAATAVTAPPAEPAPAPMDTTTAPPAKPADSPAASPAH